MSPTPTGSAPAQPPTWALLVRAANPGPMTLDGTNTWVLRSREPACTLVVDPGPDDTGHLDAVAAAATAGGARVRGIVVTHGHHDHVDGVPGLRDRTGAPLLARAHGAEFTVGNLRMRVLGTPGHTADSVCLLVRQLVAPEPALVGGGPAWPGRDQPVLVCGDTVLGRGTSVIAWPDGDLGAYLDSLDLLATLAADGAFTRLLPGHGPVLDGPVGVLAAYRRHRLERIEQVRAALISGAGTAEQVVDLVYPEIDPDQAPVLHGAAVRTAQATIDYLTPGSGRQGSSRPAADDAGQGR